MKSFSNFNPDLVKHQASGGFKLPLATLLKHAKEPQLTASFHQETQKPKEILTKTDLLNQVGLDPNVKEFSMDFEEMQEEGVYGMKSKKEIAEYVIKDLEKKIEKRKIARKELEGKVLEQRLQKESQALPEDVIIYEGDQRKQYASHILSTLEVHSVENLEALIQAHHQELLSLESQYFSSKKFKNQYKIKAASSYSWRNHSKYKNKYQNLSTFQSSKPMTEEEYLAAYEKYKTEKKQKKNKRKTSSKFMPDPDFDRYQPTSPNPKRSKSPGKTRKQINSAKIDDPSSPTRLEKPLIKYFFQKIQKHESHTNPSKTETLKFLIKNPKIMELYGLDPETLNQELGEFSSSNFMCFEEFNQFLKRKKTENAQSPIENTCLLETKDITIMKELFKEVDSFQDGVVKRTLLTEKIRNDRRLAKKLEFQALYLPAIDKVLTLNQVLKQIEQESVMAKGNKDYISWEEFEKYLKEHKIQDNPALLSKIRILKAKTLVSKTEGDENVLDLDKFLKQTLKEVFDGTTKKKDAKGNLTGFVQTFELLENIRGNQDFWKYEREIVRKKSENHNLNDENLGQLLFRIENEGPEYIVWNDFIEYFTRKGKPNFLAKKEKEENRKYEEIFMPPNIEDYEEEYETKAFINLRSASPRHSIDSPYNLKIKKSKTTNIKI